MKKIPIFLIFITIICGIAFSISLFLFNVIKDDLAKVVIGPILLLPTGLLCLLALWKLILDIFNKVTGLDDVSEEEFHSAIKNVTPPSFFEILNIIKKIIKKPWIIILSLFVVGNIMLNVGVTPPKSDTLATVGIICTMIALFAGIRLILNKIKGR